MFLTKGECLSPGCFFLLPFGNQFLPIEELGLERCRWPRKKEGHRTLKEGLEDLKMLKDQILLALPMFHTQVRGVKNASLAKT